MLIAREAISFQGAKKKIKNKKKHIIKQRKTVYRRARCWVRGGFFPRYVNDTLWRLRSRNIAFFASLNMGELWTAHFWVVSRTAARLESADESLERLGTLEKGERKQKNIIIYLFFKKLTRRKKNAAKKDTHTIQRERERERGGVRARTATALKFISSVFFWSL